MCLGSYLGEEERGGSGERVGCIVVEADLSRTKQSAVVRKKEES
jgi:hypothetical protein